MYVARGAVSSQRAAHAIRAAILFAAVVVSCHYFFTGGGQNQASRFDLVRSIVELKTLRIDAYQENTGDKALHADHYYCDKAPGASLAAVPFVAATRLVVRPRGRVDDADTLYDEARVATLVCATIPTAIATVLVYLVALTLGASAGGSAIGALAYGLGTPAWAYGTLFWGNQLTAACVLSAFAIGLRIPGSSGAATMRRSMVVGFAVGCAVVTEFSAVGAGAIVLALALLRARRGERTRVVPVAACIVAGGLGPAIVLGAYDMAAFGSPFHIGYASVVGWEEMRRGAFGVTFPKIDVLWWLLFGLQKGLFLISPVLLVGCVGLYGLVRDPRFRLEGGALAAVFVYYLLFNASYYYWTGGWAYGPRFMAAGLPFLSLGVPHVWDRGGAERRAVVVAVAVSMGLTLMAVATYPMTPEGGLWPLRDIFFPSFIRGHLSLNDGHPFFSAAPARSFNYGERMGLSGLASLVPLLAGWLVLWAAFCLHERYRRGEREIAGTAASAK